MGRQPVRFRPGPRADRPKGRRRAGSAEIGVRFPVGPRHMSSDLGSDWSPKPVSGVRFVGSSQRAPLNGGQPVLKTGVVVNSPRGSIPPPSSAARSTSGEVACLSSRPDGSDSRTRYQLSPCRLARFRISDSHSEDTGSNPVRVATASWSNWMGTALRTRRYGCSSHPEVTMPAAPARSTVSYAEQDRIDTDRRYVCLRRQAKNYRPVGEKPTSWKRRRCRFSAVLC